MTTFRLPADLVDAMRRDLQRPHRFAAERVGFVAARIGNRGGRELLVLAHQYMPVHDDDYLHDPTVGARISGHAIRRAMQSALAEQSCCFHVHMHDHHGLPQWSRVDLREIPPVARSFAAAVPTEVHGALLLSRDAVSAFLIDGASSRLRKIDRLVVVGCSLRLFP